MRLVLAAVGRLRSGPETEMAADYLKRANGLRRAAALGVVELIEVEAPKGLSGARRMAAEAALLLAAIPDGARLVALDERGDSVSTERIAGAVRNWRDQGATATALVIGGADGLDPTVRKKADAIWCFGAATWPHKLVRAMACEQIYRVATILAGHPYHRA